MWPAARWASPGDAVLTATPVYPPFMSAPQLSGRELQTALLQEGADGWRWDWAAMEAALTPRTRLLMLCHPHNPVGRVWSAENWPKWPILPAAMN